MALRLPDGWDQRDDWTELTSAAERRKRQNRLNQRAYRKRRHLQRCAALRDAQTDAGAGTGGKVEPEPHIDEGFRDGLPEPSDPGGAGSDMALGHFLIPSPKARERAIEFMHRVLADHSLNLYRPGDLPIIMRMNFFNALARNAVALRIPLMDLYNEDCISPFNYKGPNPVGMQSLTTTPDALRPTAAQTATLHHPWVDLLPAANMRDNILRAMETGRIDEDEFCDFCVDTTGEGQSDDAPAPLVVWGESWDVKSWELSADFLRKWGWVVQGCPEVIEATNFWRQKRGEMKIDFVMN